MRKKYWQNKSTNFHSLATLGRFFTPQSVWLRVGDTTSGSEIILPIAPLIFSSPDMWKLETLFSVNAVPSNTFPQRQSNLTCCLFVKGTFHGCLCIESHVLYVK